MPERPEFRRGDLLTPTTGRYAGCCGGVVAVDASGNVKLHFPEPPAGWPSPMWFDRREVKRMGAAPAGLAGAFDDIERSGVPGKTIEDGQTLDEQTASAYRRARASRDKQPCVIAPGAGGGWYRCVTHDLDFMSQAEFDAHAADATRETHTATQVVEPADSTTKPASGLSSAEHGHRLGTGDQGQWLCKEGHEPETVKVVHVVPAEQLRGAVGTPEERIAVVLHSIGFGAERHGLARDMLKLAQDHHNGGRPAPFPRLEQTGETNG